jgi:lipoprotein NlpI
MFDGSLEILRDALKSRARHSDNLNHGKYQRALVYGAMGKKSQARKDFEAIYASNPKFLDVQKRLESDSTS